MAKLKEGADGPALVLPNSSTRSSLVTSPHTKASVKYGCPQPTLSWRPPSPVASPVPTVASDCPTDLMKLPVSHRDVFPWLDFKVKKKSKRPGVLMCHSWRAPQVTMVAYSTGTSPSHSVLF